MAFEGFPFIIGWELTLACNLQCLHCGSSAGSRRTGELTSKEAMAICDELTDLLVKEVNFTGGEPLLSELWNELAVTLAKKGIITKMVTNGSLLSSDLAMQVKDAGIAHLGVSLDGPERIHDAMRRKEGLFSSVLEGVENAMRAGLPVSVITTVTASNVETLPELAELIKTLGMKSWQLQPIFPLGRTNENKGLRLTEDLFIKLGEFVAGCGSGMEVAGVPILPADSYGYYTDLDLREPQWRGCPAGIFSCGITSDGKVKGCLSLPDEIIEGDLRENDLWEIWFSPQSFPYTRSLAAVPGMYCKSCDMAEQCQGGCSAMSYAATGKFHNDPYCFYRIRKEEE